ncbi:hypothetical protein BXZ70DRAFT_1006805 [Cristinia sonorae]|uniref:Uncharacterized protein n=1 Tax=Cristinia sonorae TaxID=1940300 RepID=A0A8K0XRG1_9AGAR|nr:hypothetical protein BXZ70DRAFT_1006805 [Cristinia sonorae]
MADTLDLGSIAPTQFWDKFVAANPNLESVVRAANSGILRIFACEGKMSLCASNWTGSADVPRWVSGAVEVHIGHFPWLPPSGGTFTISFKPQEFRLILKDEYGYFLYQFVLKGSIQPSWEGLTADGKWQARS